MVWKTNSRAELNDNIFLFVQFNKIYTVTVFKIDSPILTGLLFKSMVASEYYILFEMVEQNWLVCL